MATTWVFERNDERLYVQRQEVLGELRLAAWGSEVEERVQVFEDLLQLVQWQDALDRHLVEQGWTFTNFFPERRSGMDRRDVPRGPDRRRGVGTRYTAPVHDSAIEPGPPNRRP